MVERELRRDGWPRMRSSMDSSAQFTELKSPVFYEDTGKTIALFRCMQLLLYPST